MDVRWYCNIASLYVFQLVLMVILQAVVRRLTETLCLLLYKLTGKFITAILH